jgi:hypothetical protein
MLAVHGHAVAQEAYRSEGRYLPRLSYFGCVMVLLGEIPWKSRGGVHHRVWSVLSHGTAYLDSLLAKYETRVTIKLRSLFSEQKASTESYAIIGSLWSDLPSRNNYAFR